MIWGCFDRILVGNLKIRRFVSQIFFDMYKIEREIERRTLALSAQVAARFSPNERERKRERRSHFSQWEWARAWATHTLPLTGILIKYISEFNEAVGKMTHSGCEVSWNFLPQEFELPATLATIRKVVRKNTPFTKWSAKCTFWKRLRWFTFFAVEDERNHYPLSLSPSCILYVHFRLCYRTIWRIFCMKKSCGNLGYSPPPFRKSPPLWSPSPKG